MDPNTMEPSHTVPISTLDPSNLPDATTSICGVITLLWPYSSSTHSCAFLLSDPDFRLRRQQGQVRVVFRGPSAEVVAEAHVGIGENVVLGLKGAQWEVKDGGLDGGVRTPGKGVEGTLVFGGIVHMNVGGRVVSANEADWGKAGAVHAEPMPTPAAVTKSTGTGLLGKSSSERGGAAWTYSSPAFAKRVRLSGRDDAADDWLQGADEDGSPRKKKKDGKRSSFGLGMSWRLVGRLTPTPTPSPTKERFDARDRDVESPTKDRAGIAADVEEMEVESAVRAKTPVDVASSDDEESTSARMEIDGPADIATAVKAAVITDLQTPSAQLSTPHSPSPIEAPPRAMLPPALPRLQMSADLAEAPQQQPGDHPTTPKLLPVKSPSLPLPSPFPVDTSAIKLDVPPRYSAHSLFGALGSAASVMERKRLVGAGRQSLPEAVQRLDPSVKTDRGSVAVEHVEPLDTVHKQIPPVGSDTLAVASSPPTQAPTEDQEMLDNSEETERTEALVRSFSTTEPDDNDEEVFEFLNDSPEETVMCDNVEESLEAKYGPAMLEEDGSSAVRKHESAEDDYALPTSAVSQVVTILSSPSVGTQSEEEPEEDTEGSIEISEGSVDASEEDIDEGAQTPTKPRYDFGLDGASSFGPVQISPQKRKSPSPDLEASETGPAGPAPVGTRTQQIPSQFSIDGAVPALSSLQVSPQIEEKERLRKRTFRSLFGLKSPQKGSTSLLRPEFETPIVPGWFFEIDQQPSSVVAEAGVTEHDLPVEDEVVDVRNDVEDETVGTDVQTPSDRQRLDDTDVTDEYLESNAVDREHLTKEAQPSDDRQTWDDTHVTDDVPMADDQGKAEDEQSAVETASTQHDPKRDERLVDESRAVDDEQSMKDAKTSDAGQNPDDSHLRDDVLMVDDRGEGEDEHIAQDDPSAATDLTSATANVDDRLAIRDAHTPDDRHSPDDTTVPDDVLVIESRGEAEDEHTAQADARMETALTPTTAFDGGSSAVQIFEEGYQGDDMMMMDDDYDAERPVTGNAHFAAEDAASKIATSSSGVEVIDLRSRTHDEDQVDEAEEDNEETPKAAVPQHIISSPVIQDSLEDSQSEMFASEEERLPQRSKQPVQRAVKKLQRLDEQAESPLSSPMPDDRLSSLRNQIPAVETTPTVQPRKPGEVKQEEQFSQHNVDSTSSPADEPDDLPTIDQLPAIDQAEEHIAPPKRLTVVELDESSSSPFEEFASSPFAYSQVRPSQVKAEDNEDESQADVANAPTPATAAASYIARRRAQATQAPSYPSLPLSPANSQSLQGSQPIIQETVRSELPPTPRLTQRDSSLRLDGSGSDEAPMAKESRSQTSLRAQAKGAESPFTPQKKPAKRSLRTQTSNVPDVLSEWFSPRAAKASTEERRDGPKVSRKDELGSRLAESSRSGKKSASAEANPPFEREVKGFTTPLSYFTPLSKLDKLLNPSSQQGPANTIDVFAVVTEQSTDPVRAKKGPRDFFTTFHITEPSIAPDNKPATSILVEVFRLYKFSLPAADVGDVILLRNFTVKSRKRVTYVLSTDASAWCVWRYCDAKKGATSVARAKEEMKGPPVELGKEERSHVTQLKEWWKGCAARKEFAGEDDESVKKERVKSIASRL